MNDTLNSIIDGMEKSLIAIRDLNTPRETAEKLVQCTRKRLLAVLAEAEQVDLVKTWNAEYDRHVKHYIDADSYERGIVDGKKACADELATWLAVNMPRIKAEARLEEFDLIVKERPLDPLYWDMHHIRELEAQAKPEERG